MYRAALVALLFLSFPACGPTTGGGGVVKPQDVAKACADAKDPNRDCDGDRLSPTQGDCNDADRDIYPNAPEICDNKDNDCNVQVDETCDNDGDGFTKLQQDCNDGDSLVSPGALEVSDNKIDDNCDGKIDEAVAACATAGSGDATDFAAAVGLCKPWLIEAQLNKESDPGAKAILTKFGKYMPRQGANFAVLSTGLATDRTDKKWVPPQPGTTFHNDAPNPLPMVNKNACYSGPDALNVKDFVELRLTFKVPTNAKSFSFNFNFLSAEYPEFVGSQYNDKLLVLLDSKSYKGNISFDKKQNPITVNVAFFDVCDTADICCSKDGCMSTNVCRQNSAPELDGSGFEMDDGNGNRIGGGTGWLTTTAPVTPGETATLRFIVFDQADRYLDSLVLIDNFLWQLNPANLQTIPG